MLDRLEALVRNVGIVAACTLIPAQILVGVSYLTGRKLSQFSITPLQELEWHFFFILVFLTLGAALLADRHGLTTYDAAYLELALRLGVPLATLDQDLARAAREAGVPLFN